MLYFANPVLSRPPLRRHAVHEAMSQGRLGFIDTPRQGNPIPAGATWCADNGKFGKGWPGAPAWFAFVQRRVDQYGAERCAFAVAPDVIGNAVQTRLESDPWLDPVRELGIPVAFVAQNGSEHGDLIPWDRIDVLFLGGDDRFKLGPAGLAVTERALESGKRVHMGRVNSYRRLAYAIQLGCHTADGTFLTFGPRNLERIIGWHTKAGLDNFDGFDPYDRTATLAAGNASGGHAT